MSLSPFLLLQLFLPIQFLTAFQDPATSRINSVETNQTGTAASKSPDSGVRFVLAGDSTVTDGAGWGRGFQALLKEPAECVNLARGGRSSLSFCAEGWWQKCLDASPMYLLIQFGHNDQPGKGPLRESAADGAFREHLIQYIDEAREKSIQPVLITSLTRRWWNEDGTIQSTLADYAAAAIAVAKSKQVPLIDLHALSIKQCEAVGPTAFRFYEPMTSEGADHTHLNEHGSKAVGQLVAAELIRVLPEVGQYFVAEKIKAAAVPQPHHSELTQGILKLHEDDHVISITARDKPVLSYNKQSPAVPDGITPIFHRSGFLHPVASPRGSVVTAVFPADHAHQNGIFSAWVNTTWNGRPVDFWNLGGGSGRVLHQQVVSTFTGTNKPTEVEELGFEVDLIHRAEQPPVVDILRERWKITAFSTDGTWHGFDIDSTQFCLTEKPLIVNKYHYGGMALRGPVEWLTGADRDKSPDSPEQTVSTGFLNDLGSDRLKGNHEHGRWVSMTGTINGQPVSISVLSHPDNFRAPQSARIHPTKPYFCFAPCVDEEFQIDREHPRHNRYRYLITDAAPDAAWLNQQWTAWTQTVESR